ncbi:MAG: hypothetical protein RLZ95_313 [Bacteroidota bacterium]|jgi:hypothetical protein
MKRLLTLGIFLLWAGIVQAQSPFLKINATPPKQIKQGASFKLLTQVTHNFSEEKTGGISCAFLNATTHKSVDGWFMNVFPFQYFTTIANTPFETEFSFTVPDEYKGKFEIILVAEANKIKDSVHFLIPVINK